MLRTARAAEIRTVPNGAHLQRFNAGSVYGTIILTEVVAQSLAEVGHSTVIEGRHIGPTSLAQQASNLHCIVAQTTAIPEPVGEGGRW